MKQTAVEFLVELLAHNNIIDHDLLNTRKDKYDLYKMLVGQAKKMEKDNIIYAVNKENIRCTNIANDSIKILHPETPGKLFSPDEQIGEITYKQMFEL